MSSAHYFISKFRDIKTLPHVVTRLSQLVNDDDSTMKDFEEVIKMDPTLVARLLRLVNSPYYGLIQKVDSISRAVTFIGMKNIHNIALTEALKNIFNEKDSSTNFSRNKLWLHCASVSICSKMLAERIFGINGDDAYLCGILHDFGLIIEEQVAPEKFISVCESVDPEIELPEQERAVLGTDHCEIGYLLTQEWNMTEAIQVAIRDHHNSDDTVEPDSLTGIIKLSEYITGQLNYTALPETSPALSPSLAAHVKDTIDEYNVLIDDLPKEMSKAQDIYEAKEG
ncbi:MAG: HDOD domain-containing protein [Desulfobacterales bacterium]|nr:HDOD domain-containing protein [Deltaproteobacteria bacterium]NNK96107.1 HDOD domain-containing protein [Desulfobacterales bacterium]